MNRFRQLGITGTLFTLSALLLLSACGEKDKSEVVVATVGDHEVTLDYFERKMNSFPEEAAPVDFLTRAGREEFLDTIINKEVMAIKAEELGMDSDGEAGEAAQAMARLKAVEQMHADVVAPYQEPTEDELYEYYENFGRVLTVSYMLFDTVEEAEKARGLVVGGENWQDVAARLDAGDPGPTDDWVLEMRYGTIADDLEAKVFELPVGEVSEPLDSIYGYFLIRVDSQKMKRLPPFEKMRESVRQSVIKQNSALAVNRFILDQFDAYGFEINEDVLQLVFDALPPDPPLSDPPSRDELSPLQLDPQDLDKVLMTYGDEVWTVRRYSDLYEQSSVFGRPRRENRVGGFRRALKEIAMRELMPVVAQDKGYMEDPLVRDEFKLRREQRMVRRLYEEVVAGTVKVTPEEVREYWENNREEFVKPERRKVKAVVAETEAEALQAQVAAQQGTPWEEIVEEYCIESRLKEQKGDLGEITEEAEGPIEEQAFRMGGAGDVCYPFEVGPDQWAVVKVVEVTPRDEPTFEEVRLRIGRMIEADKEEVAFQERVAEWKKDIPIETDTDALMDAVYDPREPTDTRIPISQGQGNPMMGGR